MLGCSHRNKIEREKEMLTNTTTAYDFQVCCFCDRKVDLDSKFCPCGEYKGLMTVEYYAEYLGIDWEE